MKQFKLPLGSTPFMSEEEKRALDRRKGRQVNRVHKRFKSNTKTHHHLQQIKGEPIPRVVDEDEIISGSDDQRFTLRSEIE